MNGKILKVFKNDISGNVDDRKVVMYAAFEHKKYMNKYAIFSYDGEYSKKILYYGSIHIKSDNTIVIFQVDNNAKEFIDTFTEQYLNNNLNPKEYQLIDISGCEKVELISSTEVKDYDKLTELDKLSIFRPEEIVEEDKKSGKGGLVFLLILFIALGLGLTYLYLNPDTLTIKAKQLNCTKNAYNETISLGYKSNKLVKFTSKDIPKSIDVTEIYNFNTLEEYTEFKDNNKEQDIFNKDGEYKYDDESLELRIFYKEDTIIDNYNEMYNYLIKEGYTCEEEMYDE